MDTSISYSASVFICTFVHLYLYIRTFVFVHTYICICTYINLYSYIRTFVFVYVNIHLYLYINSQATPLVYFASRGPPISTTNVLWKQMFMSKIFSIYLHTCVFSIVYPSIPPSFRQLFPSVRAHRTSVLPSSPLPNCSTASDQFLHCQTIS